MAENVISIREADGNIIRLEIYNELQSTASLARQYAKEGYPDRYVVFSEKQGKTTLTGNKATDEGMEYGMFMSLILRPSFFPSQASLLGALSASATVSALEEHTTKQLGIGWVSNIYCNGKRIGGTSIEAKLDNFTTFEYIIINFAIKLDNKNFPPRLTDMIKKVFESENTSISMIIARNILSKFFRYYPNIKNSSKFMNIYNEKFAQRGKRIKYDDGQNQFRCKILSVHQENGSLIIDRRGKEENVTSPTFVSIPKRIKIKKK